MDFQAAIVKDPLVRREWERFCQEGTVTPGIVRSVILRSWTRLKEKGFNPLESNVCQVPQEELTRRIVKNKLLLDCATPVLEMLFSDRLANRTNIAVADSDGVILFKLDAAGKPEKVAPYVLGGSGSQAVLTCLWEKAPVTVIASEHYCEPRQAQCCYVTPIKSSRRGIAGILAFSTPKEDVHFLLVHLLETTAGAIGDKLKQKEISEERNALISLLDKGMLTLTSSGIIRTISPKARAILQLGEVPDDTYIGELIEPNPLLQRLLLEKKSCQREPVVLANRSGGHFSCLLSATYSPSGDFFLITLVDDLRSHLSLEDDKQEEESDISFDDLLGVSQIWTDTVRMGRQMSRSDIPVLISGEAGTGKTLMAKAIHSSGYRSEHPFISVNCGAIPLKDVRSTLLGYKAGTIGGEDKYGRPGLFEQADGGTLFLNKVEELSTEAQDILLQLLKNHAVHRIGGDESHFVDVRIIAATAVDLAEATRKGSFREDLYQRLSIYTLNIPPLRAHIEDLPIIFNHLMFLLSHIEQRAPRFIGPEVLNRLQSYSWPNNIRELEHLVRLLFKTQTANDVSLDELPTWLTSAPISAIPPKSTPGTTQAAQVQSDETDMPNILDVLRKTRGNVKAAAVILGISRTGLYYKLRCQGIDPSRYRLH